MRTSLADATRTGGTPPPSADIVRANPSGPYAGAVVSMVGYRQHGGPPQPTHRAPLLRVFLGIDAPVTIAGTEGDPRAVRAHEILGPLTTRYALIPQPRPREGIQVFVHPLASRWLFGAPASRLPGLVLDLHDVAGGPVAALRQRIADDDDWESRFAAMRDFLAARAGAAVGAAAASPRPEIIEGLRWIGQRGGAGRMDDLAAHVCLGPRQLRAVFVAELGLGPKVISRLVRFQRCMAMVRGMTAGTSGDTLADIAARAGFADHAHLDREFRALVGISPSSWAEQEGFTVRAGRLGPAQGESP